jgi:hypothetical protein
MKKAFGALLCLLLVSGCGGGNAEKEMGGGEAFVYPELDTFDQEAFFGIGYPAARGAWGDVKKFVNSETYQAAVKKFEAAALPSGYSGRQGAKDELVAAAKDLSEKAKANAPNPEIEAAYKKVLAAKGKLMTGDAPAEPAK